MNVTHICIPQKVDRKMRCRSLAVAVGSLSVAMTTPSVANATGHYGLLHLFHADSLWFLATAKQKRSTTTQLAAF